MHEAQESIERIRAMRHSMDEQVNAFSQITEESDRRRQKQKEQEIMMSNVQRNLERMQRSRSSHLNGDASKPRRTFRSDTSSGVGTRDGAPQRPQFAAIAPLPRGFPPNAAPLPSLPAPKPISQVSLSEAGFDDLEKQERSELISGELASSKFSSKSRGDVLEDAGI